MSIATRTGRKDRTIGPLTIAPRRWRWYHGVLFYGIVQIMTFGLSALVSVVRGRTGNSLREDIFGNQSYFNALKQSIFTPPAWVFGPAWTINNVSVIWGTLPVLNKSEGTPGRTAYLTLQGASWLNYIVFNAAYFSLRSPINALVITFTMFVLTIASLFVAIFKLKDTRVALSLATLMAWLMLALTAALFQAAWNNDDLYQVGPFVEANRRLVKGGK